MGLWEDVQLFYEEHPTATWAIAGGVLLLGAAYVAVSRVRKRDTEQYQETPVYPIGRLMDAYPPTIIQQGSQVVTIRPPRPEAGQPPSPVAPNLRRFQDVPGLSCPRGSKLKQRSDGTWTCISDRTGKEIPIRQRDPVTGQWKPVI
jgi:hypothetical protein